MLSKKEKDTLKAICNKVAPNVSNIEDRILEVLNALHPYARKAWFIY